MKRFLLVLLALLPGFVFGADAGAELSSAAFLDRVRNFHSTGTYSKLSGTLQHRRRGGEVEKCSIYFGVIIQQDRFTGQLVIAGRDYLLISQARKSGVSAVTVLAGSMAVLDRVGLKATDLTLGFLHGKFLRELPRESLSLAPCRVLLLEDEKSKEEIKVWISSDHYFPLRAAFFRKGEKEPFRILECNGFTKRNGLYYARLLNIEGPGWRTRVAFDADKAELGLFDPQKPVNIMKPMPAGGKK